MSQLQLFAAGAPELVRSNQKDRFYAEHIHGLLSDITRQLLPLRWWLNWQRELQLAAEIAYYGLTTVLGNQTLGEEYCNTVQVGSPGRNDKKYVVPGTIRRGAAIVLQILGPYLVEKGFEAVYQKIRDRDLGQWIQSEHDYEVLEKYAGYIEEFLNVCSRLHLALFYINGLFYHLGKRLTGIRYVMIRYGLAKGQDQYAPQLNTYRILGLLILLQVAIKLYSLVSVCVKRRWNHVNSTPSDGDDTTHNVRTKLGLRIVLESATVPKVTSQSNFKCPLCLEQCKVQTATPCGHIFCWSCIAEWCSDKAECPICRATSHPQQLVCLQYFQH